MAAEALKKSQLSTNYHSFSPPKYENHSLMGQKSPLVALFQQKQAAASAGDAVGRLAGSDGEGDRDVIIGIGEERDPIKRSRDPCIDVILAPGISPLPSVRKGGGASMKI